MKLHTPLFIIGLLVFITPAVNLPGAIEGIVIAAYGVAIMLFTSTLSSKKKDNK